MLSGERAALEAIRSEEVEVLLIGEAGGDQIVIDAAEHSLTMPLAEAREAWESLAALD